MTLRTETGEWEAGEYTLSLSFDGVTHECAFSVPDNLPSQGSVDMLDCSPRLDAYLQQEVTCVEHNDDDSSSLSCTPVPDQYYLNAWFYGTPSSVDVALARGGDELIEETQALTYEESRPNGPECEPLCRQASVEIEV
ncbi:MAG TPA: hypothetical protein VGK73_16840, partial [Polyangiaceae bacterium]